MTWANPCAHTPTATRAAYMDEFKNRYGRLNERAAGYVSERKSARELNAVYINGAWEHVMQDCCARGRMVGLR